MVDYCVCCGSEAGCYSGGEGERGWRAERAELARMTLTFFQLLFSTLSFSLFSFLAVLFLCARMGSQIPFEELQLGAMLGRGMFGAVFKGQWKDKVQSSFSITFSSVSFFFFLFSLLLIENL